MKIMVMTDMEGVAGIVNHDDWVVRDSYYYAKGQRLITEEVNAAVEGLFEGGATEIVVYDGHGERAIDPEILSEHAMLMVGYEEKYWYPYGLDASFDGICWVGQHAKSGTDYSHITHTGWFRVLDISINGISVGEYGELALCAMELGVPCIFGCGENAFCLEAEALTPGIITVPVKWGLKPDGLDCLEEKEYGVAKLSALHLSPIEARKRIREGAAKAAEALAKDPSRFHFPLLTRPYEKIVRYRKSGDIPPCTKRATHPDSFIELLNAPELPVSPH